MFDGISSSLWNLSLKRAYPSLPHSPAKSVDCSGHSPPLSNRKLWWNPSIGFAKLTVGEFGDFLRSLVGFTVQSLMKINEGLRCCTNSLPFSNFWAFLNIKNWKWKKLTAKIASMLFLCLLFAQLFKLPNPCSFSPADHICSLPSPQPWQVPNVQTPGAKAFQNHRTTLGTRDQGRNQGPGSWKSQRLTNCLVVWYHQESSILWDNIPISSFHYIIHCRNFRDPGCKFFLLHQHKCYGAEPPLPKHTKPKKTKQVASSCFR